MRAEPCPGRPASRRPQLGDEDIVQGHHRRGHGEHRDELTGVLGAAGIDALERDSRVLCIDDIDVGIVGLKGFVGGFSGSSHLPDFGEPLLRRLYAETSADVEALDRELREVALCPVRIGMLHYAPTTTTIDGEPSRSGRFWTPTGCAAPIAEHEPDMVLHGHAHAGTFAGAIGGVPVYNVSVPVIGRDFWIFEFERRRHPGPAIH